MEGEDDSNYKPLKEACRCLLTIAVGFLSCAIMVVLIYFSYHTFVGNMSYCTLCTDIPGRVAIILLFYFAAGVCGTFPIPEDFRMECLPEPFILYKKDSWKCLFENLRLLFTFNNHDISFSDHDSETIPLLTPQTSPENIPIPSTSADTPKKTPKVRSFKTPSHRYVERADSARHSLSFDSPLGGHIVPMVKGKSSKPPYFPESSLSSTESSQNPGSADAASVTVCELSGTLYDRATRAVVEIREEVDTPPRSPDLEYPIPSYPRFPWSCLKYRGGVPEEMRALHKRHLMAERREIDRYNKQKMKETVQSPKDSSEHEWITDSDDFNPFWNRPLRLPPYPPRRKTCFRGRTKSTPGALRRLGKYKVQQTRIRVASSAVQRETYPSVHTRSVGDNRDGIDREHEIKCCENSPGLQVKVELINRTLMRLGQSRQASCEASASERNRTSMSLGPRCQASGEASTSKSNRMSTSLGQSPQAIDEASTSKSNRTSTTLGQSSQASSETSTSKTNQTSMSLRPRYQAGNQTLVSLEPSRQASHGASAFEQNRKLISLKEIYEGNGEKSTSKQNKDVFDSRTSDAKPSKEELAKYFDESDEDN